MTLHNIPTVIPPCPWPESLFALFSPSPLDACRSAFGTDALINWQALSEPFEKTQDRLRELVCPP